MTVSQLARPLPRPVRRSRPAAIRRVPQSVRVALYVFIATLPFEAIPIADFLTGRFSLARIAGYTFFLLALFNAGTVLRRPRPAVVWFGVWVAVLAAWIPFQPAELLSPTLRHVTQLVQMVVLAWAASNVLRTNRAWRTALVVLVCSSAALAIYVSAVPPEFAGDRNSALGENPNTLGATFAVAAVGAGGLVGQLVKGPARLFFGLLVVPLLAALVGTGSRAAMAALLAGIMTILLRSRGLGGKVKAFILLAPVVAALAYAVVSSETMVARLSQAVNERRFAKREYIVPTTIEMIRERPFLGWGPEKHLLELGARLNRDFMDEHNLYLWVLNEGGLVAFVPFMFGALLVVRDAERARRVGRGNVIIALVATVAIANMAHSHHNRKIIWVVLAMAASTPRISRVGPPPGVRRVAVPEVPLTGETP